MIAISAPRAWRVAALGAAAMLVVVAASPGADDLDSILEMSPEELRARIDQAIKLQLTAERLLVLTEIKDGTLYPLLGKAERDRISHILHDNPANTRQDNIDRICRALARSDMPFKKAHDLFAAGKCKQAAAEAAKIITRHETTYLSAAKRYVRAESLSRSGQLDRAADAFMDLTIDLPDRTSFAAAAAIRAAETYEKVNRFAYAMQMYQYAIINYELTIDQADYEKYVEKVAYYAKIYEDPMKAIVGWMSDVHGRLGACDSGKKTQKVEKDVIDLLDDIIKTLEEQEEQEQDQKDKKPGKQSKKPGNKGSTGSGSLVPVPSRPTSPAPRSKLPGGVAVKPPRMANVHAGREPSDWATLGPLRKKQIRQALRKAVSERYHDAISDYHRRLSEQTGP